MDGVERRFVMWDAKKRQRFQDLRERELDGVLSESEQTELAQLIQELEDMEIAYLAPALERLRQENSQLQAEAKALEKQKEELEELLRQKEAYLAHARAFAQELEAARLDLLERFARIAGEPLRATEPTEISSR
jgi:DNA repair exonuclease SbcCD ATPase subunit